MAEHRDEWVRRGTVGISFASWFRGQRGLYTVGPNRVFLLATGLAMGCTAELAPQPAGSPASLGKRENDTALSATFTLDPDETHHWSPPCAPVHAKCDVFVHVRDLTGLEFEPNVRLAMHYGIEGGETVATDVEGDTSVVLARPFPQRPGLPTQHKPFVSLRNDGDHAIELTLSANLPVDWRVHEIDISVDDCPLVVRSHLLGPEAHRQDPRCEDARPLHQRGRLTLAGLDEAGRRVVLARLQLHHDVEPGVASAGDEYQSRVVYAQGDDSLDWSDFSSEGQLAEALTLRAHRSRTGSLHLRAVDAPTSVVSDLVYTQAFLSLRESVVNNQEIFDECAYAPAAYAMGGMLTVPVGSQWALTTAGVAGWAAAAVFALGAAIGATYGYVMYVLACLAARSRDSAAHVDPPPAAPPPGGT